MERKRLGTEHKTVSETSILFQMRNLRGRTKAKKKSNGGMQAERENMSPVMETEMSRLRRNTTEEEKEAEGRKSWDSGRSFHRCEEESDEDACHQKGLLTGSRASVEEQEEETDVDEVPTSKWKSVRWTDVCQRDEVGGVKEEVKTEERIKQQLFSGVC